MPGKYDDVLAALKKAKAELPSYHATNGMTWSIRKTDVAKAISVTESLYDDLRRANHGEAVAPSANRIWLNSRNHSWETTEGDFCLAPDSYVVFVAETLDAWIQLYEEANNAR